jgi:Vacuolar protein sorting-associated protein 62
MSRTRIEVWSNPFPFPANESWMEVPALVGNGGRIECAALAAGKIWFGDETILTFTYTEAQGSPDLAVKDGVAVMVCRGPNQSLLWSLREPSRPWPARAQTLADLRLAGRPSLVSTESYFCLALRTPENGVELWRSSRGVDWKRVIAGIPCNRDPKITTRGAEVWMAAPPDGSRIGLKMADLGASEMQWRDVPTPGLETIQFEHNVAIAWLGDWLYAAFRAPDRHLRVYASPGGTGSWKEVFSVGVQCYQPPDLRVVEGMLRVAWQHPAQNGSYRYAVGIPAENQPLTEVPPRGDSAWACILKRFAPKVVLHPNETCNPHDVLSFLGSVSMKLDRMGPINKTIHERVGDPGKLATAYSDVYLDFPPGTSIDTMVKNDKFKNKKKALQSIDSNRFYPDGAKDNKLDPEYIFDDGGNKTLRKGKSNADLLAGDAPCYCRVRVLAGGTQVDLQYHFFYAYNDMGFLSLGEHVGDWERITVRVKAPFASSSDIVRMVYAGHGGGGSYAGDQNKYAEGFAPGTHPEIYSARGSHASYNPKKPDDNWGPFKDQRGNGAHWYTWANLREIAWNHSLSSGDESLEAYSVEIQEPDMRWLWYPGVWGQSTLPESPDGPGMSTVFWIGDKD